MFRNFPVGIPMGLFRYPHDGEDFGAVALAKVEIDRVGGGKIRGFLIKCDEDAERVIGGGVCLGIKKKN